MKARYESRTMKAWWVDEPAPLVDGASGRGPLVLGERADPEPAPREIRVRVSRCGVCRTDLHLAEGDLPVHRPHTIPGHEVVGIVDRLGEGASRFALGARVGIPWLRHTCGVCRFCRRGAENLCIDPRFTGWDADGGFAERAVIDEDFAYALPDEFDDDGAAPLLCAGIIGYRA
jgi:propanol-preferring alcohol dehydrogenase